MRAVAKNGWSVALLLVFGCAAEQKEVIKQPFPVMADATPLKAAPADGSPAPVGSDFDAKAYAARYVLPVECEEGARKLQSRSADAAWAVLKACVDKGNFTLIRKLVDETWKSDLQKRPEAGALVARVIAQRGGDVGGDLALAQQKKVPVFTLGAAMKQPDTYKGRLVLVRARVSDIRSTGGKPTVKVTEYTLGGETEEVEVGPKHKSKFKAGRSESGSGSVEYDTTNYGSGKASGEYTSGGSYSSESERVKTEQRHDNVARETGREALGRLKEADPFLEPDKDFIILARFNGVKATPATEDDEGGSIADLSILTYYEPNPLLIE